MASLTIRQINRLRRQIGDTNVNEYDLSDSELDEEYQDNDEDFDDTIVSCLRLRLGIALRKIDTSFSDGQGTSSEQRSQEVAAIERMLAYWETKTGTSGGILRAGVISLGLDQDEETA